MTVKIEVGDCLEVLRGLPDGNVNCCVTSPPYFGLRDYGTAKWEGGDPECDHRQGRPGTGRADGIVDERAQRNRDGVGAMGGDCGNCGGRRIDSQIGLEPTPDAYVAKLVAVFREVRRVLRDDGTLWLNLGDSYAGGGRGGNPEESPFRKQATNTGSVSGRAKELGVVPAGLKPKDLIGIPWRVAFALQADGWWLRQDIIWHKPNPMPESVTDRCTKAHEYIFLLAKSARYYYDAGAIAEESIHAGAVKMNAGGKNAEMGDYGQTRGGFLRAEGVTVKATRNKRTVWTVSTKPYKGAHFATFPPDLIEPCILAGCPEGGTVLDPFCGTGTAGLVADRHYRNALLIELNPEYADMARKRIDGEAPLFAEAP